MSATLAGNGLLTEKLLLVMKHTCKIFAFFATFAVILSLLSASVFAQKTKEENNDQSMKPTVGFQTPKVIKIDELSIKELLKPKKKPLLVNFWATWCIPCREEFPDLVELDREYKNKIDFITISLDDLAEIDRDVPKFLAEMKASMPAYLLKTNDENAVIGSISKNWQGGLPFTILYDKDGNTVHTKQGKIKPDIVRGKLAKLTEIGPASKARNSRLPFTIYPKSRFNYKTGITDAKRDIANKLYIIKKLGFRIVKDHEKDATNKYGIKFESYGCFGSKNLSKYVEGYNRVSISAIKSKFGYTF